MRSREDVPIACTLDPQSMGVRLDEIQRLTREHLRTHDLAGCTLALVYDATAAPELKRIVDLERACCAFLAFKVHHGGDTVQLTIEAPGGDSETATWLFQQFLPRPPDHPSAPSRCAGDGCCSR